LRDQVIPWQEQIETVSDDSDLQDIYNSECQLFYVVCTNARDSLLAKGITSASEFLSDLQGEVL